MRARIFGVSVLFSLAIALLIFPAAVQAAWQPSKPIEFVVAWQAGGGSDILARTVASIIETEKLAPVPIVVVNKVGGNTAVAQSYVHGKKGDPHILIVTAWGLTAVPVLQKLPEISVTQLTPITRFFMDEQLYYVLWDSPYKSIRDLVAAAKKSPGSIKMGGGVVGDEDHITNLLFEQAAGITTNFISFGGGGGIMREVLGGHVDAGILNPSEGAAQYEAKKVRPLAVASRKRLPGMPEVPTFTEEGINFVFEEFQRGVAAPPAIAPEAANYYVDLMRRMMQTSKWQAFVKANVVTPAVLEGKEFGEYLRRQEELVRQVYTPLGLVKQ
jgi:putative tricarboxylic transport membrane protein